LRKFALFLLPVMLLAAACGSSNKTTTTTKTSTPKSGATAAATSTKAPAATATTAASLTTAVAPPQSSRGTTGSGDAASALFDTVNPFELLNGLSGAPSSGDVDPVLSAVLLSSRDLPSGFVSMGDFGYNIPSSQYGPMQMAADIFTSGDMTSGSFGTMVMSAAIALPQDAIDQLDALGGFDQLGNISDSDLQSLQGAAEQFGVEFSDMRVLDGSGLGDGGVGMHMVLDFSGLMDAFGAPEGDNPLAGGIAMEVYVFARGDHLLMTMVMWSAGDASGVDSRGLADALYAHAAGAF
jgi:hypothetical protein